MIVVLGCMLVLYSIGAIGIGHAESASAIIQAPRKSSHIEVKVDSIKFLHSELYADLTLYCELFNHSGHDVIVFCEEDYSSYRDYNQSDTLYCREAYDKYCSWSKFYSNYAPVVRMDIMNKGHMYSTTVQYEVPGQSIHMLSMFPCWPHFELDHLFSIVDDKKIYYKVLKDGESCLARVYGWILIEPEYLEMTSEKRLDLLEAIRDNQFTCSMTFYDEPRAEDQLVFMPGWIAYYM